VSAASVHVGVRTGIGHGSFVGTACARRRRFVNGKRTNGDGGGNNKNDSEDTTGEKRESRLGRQKVTTHLSDEYLIPGYRRRHTDATNGENEIYSNSIRPRTRKILTQHTAQRQSRTRTRSTAHSTRNSYTKNNNNTRKSYVPVCVYAIPFFQ